ncbi:DNA-binding domain-containing protein [Breoghania sp.]|uniref:HvfC/BufC N-terminal domain-containing protein n=1 Tax=Breoghania sp. TaxID=2065378 RepID=UPI002AA700CF|nr:DNA-binding domain-containing protein [Breoghania sp.]
MAQDARASGEAAFAEALFSAREKDIAAPPGLSAPAGGGVGRRFAVYRNNVAVSLAEALMATYPALVRLLGEDYFRALAAEFVPDHPPRSPVLLDYGAEFGDFIDGFPPLAGYPYLGDVARLEYAWLRAFHAADAPPLSPQSLSGIAGEALATIRFTAHPATCLLRSRYPVVALFEANRDGGHETPDGQGPEDALVTRPGLCVEVRRMPAGGAVFLGALIAGATLGEAVADAQAETDAFDPARAIALLLEAGAFADMIEKG